MNPRGKNWEGREDSTVLSHEGGCSIGTADREEGKEYRLRGTIQGGVENWKNGLTSG